MSESFSRLSPAQPREEERIALERFRDGDVQALVGFWSKYQPVLLKVLMARGADATEAADVLADLWGDCVPSTSGRRSLLEKFSGRCSLQSWLITVATHRLIDRKRRLSHQCDVQTTAHD